MLLIDHTIHRHTGQLPSSPVVEGTGNEISPGVIPLWPHQHGVDQIVMKLWELLFDCPRRIDKIDPIAKQRKKPPDRRGSSTGQTGQQPSPP